jgi:molybdopterin converting factor small subunit
MRVTVSFFSYFKELTGCAQTMAELAEGSTLGDLQKQLCSRFPKLSGFEASTLAAVGYEYQQRTCVLKEGDQVSLFPPVQGG